MAALTAEKGDGKVFFGKGQGQGNREQRTNWPVWG